MTPQLIYLEIGMLLGRLLILGVLMLLLRPLILWYFQLNRRTKALEAIEESLSYLPAVQQGRSAKVQRNRRAA